MKNVADKDLELGGRGREIDGEKVTKKVYKGDDPTAQKIGKKFKNVLLERRTY